MVWNMLDYMFDLFYDFIMDVGVGVLNYFILFVKFDVMFDDIVFGM